MVLLSPALAWVVWVSWADGKPSDQAYVAWFVTVAVGCAVAGALAATWALNRQMELAALAAVSTLVTLTVWGASEGDQELYMLGVVIAVLPVSIAAPTLVATGAAIRKQFRQ